MESFVLLSFLGADCAVSGWLRRGRHFPCRPVGRAVGVAGGTGRFEPIRDIATPMPRSDARRAWDRAVSSESTQPCRWLRSRSRPIRIWTTAETRAFTTTTTTPLRTTATGVRRGRQSTSTTHQARGAAGRRLRDDDDARTTGIVIGTRVCVSKGGNEAFRVMLTMFDNLNLEHRRGVGISASGPSSFRTRRAAPTSAMDKPKRTSSSVRRPIGSNSYHIEVVDGAPVFTQDYAKEIPGLDPCHKNHRARCLQDTVIDYRRAGSGS